MYKMGIIEDGSKLYHGIKSSGHKQARKKRQKKKLKKAKKAGDEAEVAKMKTKIKKTNKQKRKADKDIISSSVNIGKTGLKAGYNVATGNPVGAVVEFI